MRLVILYRVFDFGNICLRLGMDSHDFGRDCDGVNVFFNS